jgi:hypothetical protein
VCLLLLLQLLLYTVRAVVRSNKTEPRMLVLCFADTLTKDVATSSSYESVTKAHAYTLARVRIRQYVNTVVAAAFRIQIVRMLVYLQVSLY